MKTAWFTIAMIIPMLVSSWVFAAPPGVNSKVQTLILTIENDNGVYRVLDARVISGNIPRRKVLNKPQAELSFYLKDQFGDVLGQGKTMVANSIRGVFEEGSRSHQNHGEFEQERNVFVLRYPYEKGMEIISLIERSNLPTARNSTAVPAHNINFADHLRGDF